MADKAILCRCEDISLHDVEEAIARGYRDVESVKRYTGFGTGWCQGKYCLAPCARVIHERTGGAVEPFTARPPFHPVPLAHLAGLEPKDEP